MHILVLNALNLSSIFLPVSTKGSETLYFFPPLIVINAWTILARQDGDGIAPS